MKTKKKSAVADDMGYTPQWYASPIDLRERRSGKFAVRHRIIEAGEEVPVIGLRQAITRGRTPIMAKPPEPLRVHELVEDGKRVWMTDLPEELNQIAEMLYTVGVGGNVCVGGLGLGIVATTVAQRRGVDKVVVVERSRDVIRLCAQPGLYEVRCMDITAFLKDDRRAFDYYLLDTWQGTSEDTWWSEVMPLRRLIMNKWGYAAGEIHCWAEDIMWGQVHRSLQLHGTISPPQWYYSYLPCPMSSDEAIVFLNTVGTPRWEKVYGAAIDRYITEHTARRAHAKVKA